VPPQDLDSLKAEIARRYGGLARRLKQIARFATDNPNDIALETIAVIAKRANVQPSSLIRFAQALGYAGFTDMQRVFRAPLSTRLPSYSERVKIMRAQLGNGSAKGLLTEYVLGNIAALERLQEEVREDDLEGAVELLRCANRIHLMGQRRAFPVVTYAAYALSRLPCQVHLVDSIGGMALEQGRQVVRGDVLVAVSFEPYSADVASVAAGAEQRGADVIAITDSPLSPIAAHATLSFSVHDADVRMFRSLAASMSLAQALVIALAYRLEKE
jgi:DNA-binding MurR/RpiR family transcriptional regulator